MHTPVLSCSLRDTIKAQTLTQVEHTSAAEHLGQLKMRSVIKVNRAAVVYESALVTLSLYLILYFTFHTCAQTFGNANIFGSAFYVDYGVFELLTC